MARDDFKKGTRDEIMKRSGYRCAFPSCRRVTHGPKGGNSESTNLGVAAHITAASENGPRFNSKMSSEERSSASNGIWMCENHAKLIDKDDQQYSTELLHKWKTEAEEIARHEMQGGLSLLPIFKATVKPAWEFDIINKYGLGLLIEVQSISEDPFIIEELNCVIGCDNQTAKDIIESFDNTKVRTYEELPPPKIGHQCLPLNAKKPKLNYKDKCSFFAPIWINCPVPYFFQRGYEVEINCKTNEAGSQKLLDHKDIKEHINDIMRHEYFPQITGERFSIIVQMSSYEKPESPPVGKLNHSTINIGNNGSADDFKSEGNRS